MSNLIAIWILSTDDLLFIPVLGKLLYIISKLDVAIVPLDDCDACPHLLGKEVDIHTALKP